MPTAPVLALGVSDLPSRLGSVLFRTELVRWRVVLDDALQAAELGALVQADQRHALGGAAEFADLADAGAYRSLAAVLKYDQQIAAVRSETDDLSKGYYGTEAQLVSEIRERVAPGLDPDAPFKTVECAIMDIADDIAYSTYDLEDSLHAGFASPLSLARALASDDVVQEAVIRKTNAALKKEGHKPVIGVSELLEVIVEVFSIELPAAVSEIVGKSQPATALATLAVGLEAWRQDKEYSDSLVRTQFTAERVGRLIAEVQLKPNTSYPQLSGITMSRRGLLQVEVLKHLNYELVIRSPRLTVVEYRGRDVVTAIFTALCESKGTLLPESWRSRYAEAAAVGVTEVRRLICDYVACMTDRYAAELHARLFSDGLSMFKPL